MQQIFISHSKEDRELLRELEGVFSKAGFKQYIASFEDQTPPISEDIKEEIRRSRAMIVLLGPEAYENDVTKIWIGWEAGIAIQQNKPVWIFEDVNSQIEMFVPGLTDYVLYDRSMDGQKRTMRDIIEGEFAPRGRLKPGPMAMETEKREDLPRNANIDPPSKVTLQPRVIVCPYQDCGENYTIWSKGPEAINCASCRRPIDVSAVPVIEVGDDGFNPIFVKLDVGDSVKWINTDGRNHTVSDIEGYGVDSWDFEGDLSSKDQMEYTFDREGNFGFQCSVHGRMQECGIAVVGDVSYDGTLPCI